MSCHAFAGKQNYRYLHYRFNSSKERCFSRMHRYANAKILELQQTTLRKLPIQFPVFREHRTQHKRNKPIYVHNFF